MSLYDKFVTYRAAPGNPQTSDDYLWVRGPEHMYLDRAELILSKNADRRALIDVLEAHARAVHEATLSSVRDRILRPSVLDREDRTQVESVLDTIDFETTVRNHIR